MENCRACGKIIPGLVDHCRRHGRLLINEWAMREHSAKVSAVIVACEARAIMVRPVDTGGDINQSQP